MPLLDHFHDPVKRRLGWSSLHSGWATFLANNLDERWLPPPLLAVENTHRSMAIEIDVAAFEAPQPDLPSRNGGVATHPRLWTAPPPRATAQIDLGGVYEVLVYVDVAGWELVGAIELVSPDNKKCPESRAALVGKCAGLLSRGVSVVIMDVVTERRANLHNQLLELFGMNGDAALPPDTPTYASAYQYVRRDGKPELRTWAEPCRIGDPLPTMPLRVRADLVVPVEFEEAYMQICRVRRVI